MEQHIKNLSINNFKSIRQINMDCSRINLIIGRPNVGKSNILEALSLFCARYSKSESKFLGEFIRYNDFSELFFDQDTSEEISLQTNLGVVSLANSRGKFLLTFGEMLKSIENHRTRTPTNYPPLIPGEQRNEPVINQIQVSIEGKKGEEFKNYPNSRLPIKSHPPSVKKYTFKTPEFIQKLNNYTLLAPFGENLFSVIMSNSKLKKEIAEWFKTYNLDFVLDKRSKSLSVQKREGNIVYPISYNLIADTLQRIIFHYAAIESNKDSILLFEEPESHSFPPYITELAHKIMDGENNNQYFITTHSPFLFNTIVENTDFKDLSVFFQPSLLFR